MAKTALTKKSGERVYYTAADQAIQIPNLIEHHLTSWQQFTATSIAEIFGELNPIDDYTGQKLSLRFVNHRFGEPKEDVLSAKKNMTTYDAPLYVEVELTNKVTGEIKTNEIYFGDYPWMTDQGTFVANGTERVVVSQLTRSNGVFFSAENNGIRNSYSAKIIPGRGAWLEFDTDKQGVINVKIDKKRKLPATVFLRALGITTNTEIKKLFADIDNGDVQYIANTLSKDPTTTRNEALVKIYSLLRPGDLATIDNAREVVERTFFDYRSYDYSRVGRYKINRRLNLDTPNDAEHRTLQMDDLVAIIREIIRLNNTQEAPDDIDALDSRRVKLVGELVERSFRMGMLRLRRNILDRMSMSDPATVTPAQLINSRPVVASVREFFMTSQLSQLIDNTNPFSELAHKRRLSSAGPGGLTAERADFEVRDAHPSHYGRICTIETPEGKNVGLVLNLATYARINEYGFIEAPYRVVKNGKVTDEIVYVDAAAEKSMVIADAGVSLTKDNKFADARVSARIAGTPTQVESSKVTHVDAAHNEILGISAGLIPFVEKNRVDRSLMACAMQKQAVPLLRTDSPTIGTGTESIIASNTSQLITAEADGTVTKADANSVIVKYKTGEKEYQLTHFSKTNDDNCYNQHTVVSTGDKVKAGDILIEGASISGGEVALGRNLIVAFMPWKGYNMDDAIIINKRLVENDDLTSIGIQDFEIEVRETKLGPEQITRDIPNVSEYTLRHLDEEGLVRIGAEVKTGDILVGKITPKGEQELSSEERLLRAIFGEKAKDVRDSSVRYRGANTGKVIDIQTFTREAGHELKPGVLMKVRIYVAEIRKISVGDKLSGRYGNKGVISRILPNEDMPFLEDGTPIDILLSPMGVPSRMNIGQLFEIHLGLVADALGIKIATPSFNGVSSEKVSEELEKAGFHADGQVQLYDGLTGEPFERRTTVGIMHMLKLHHMVDDKIHARSTGPYTMVTQQPLGGRAQNGGQRFGEMEVWALEAYGAATVLQEMLTIKSDDVFGRTKAYESIIKNEPIKGPKLPEGFNVLVKELQGLSLKVDLLAGDKVADADVVIEHNVKAESVEMPAVALSEDAETISIEDQEAIKNNPLTDEDDDDDGADDLDDLGISIEEDNITDNESEEI